MDAETIEVGQWWVHTKFGYTCRVMAANDNYVMLRKKGCAPFVISFSALERFYTLNPMRPKKLITQTNK